MTMQVSDHIFKSLMKLKDEVLEKINPSQKGKDEEMKKSEIK